MIREKRIPEEFPIPKDLVDRISMECESRGYGLMLLGDKDNGIHMILMGDGQMTADEAAVYMAHVLLAGVVHGETQRANMELRMRVEEESDRKPS